MGSWNVTNVGASPKPEFVKHVEKIFDYIGYAPYYVDTLDSDGFFPEIDDVYRCLDSNNIEECAHIKDCFDVFDEIELLYILNALFPKTKVYTHHSEGNSCGWVADDEIYDPEKMVHIIEHHEYDEDFDMEDENGPDRDSSEEKELLMKPPKAEHIQALIDLSTADGNTELTALLLEVAEKLKKGEIVYEDGKKKKEGDVDQLQGLFNDLFPPKRN